MIHGTKKEAAVLDTLSSLSFVRGLKYVRRIRHKGYHILACLLDGVCYREISDDLKDLGWDTFGEEYTIGHAVEEKLVNETVEVNTNVARS